MANVDAEQNAVPSQQTEETLTSESITLSEANLEALLRGVTDAAAPAPRQTAAPPPATERPAVGRPEPVAKAGPDKRGEPVASLASLQEPPSVAAVPPPPFEASPATIAPMQTVHPVASQPDVNSKLALISAIKQRRAVTPRPEAPAADIGYSASAAVPLEHQEAEHTESESSTEHTAEMEEQIAEGAPSETVAERVSRPVPTGPLGPRPVKVSTETQKASLPAKKVWTSGTSATPAERRNDVRTETPRPEVAKKASPKATVAAPPAEASDSSESQELFATFGSGVQQEQAKPASFITSKAGIGAIGGAVAAAALIVYLLTAHGSKKETMTTSAPAAAPVEVSSSVAADAAANETKASAAANATNPHAAPTAVSTTTPVAKPAPGFATGQSPAQQIPLQNLPTQQAAAPETPRTVARAFTAPTAARPTSSPVVDAAPNLAISSATPTQVGLSGRIAPLPPPPAPVPAPAAAPAQPRQLNVAGGVQAAKLIRQVVPAYPAVAKAARVQGTVRFRALIGPDGAVKSLTTLGGPLPLAQAAADAVRQWRYQPTLVDGKPVEVTTQIDVAFTL